MLESYECWDITDTGVLRMLGFTDAEVLRMLEYYGCQGIKDDVVLRMLVYYSCWGSDLCPHTSYTPA